MHGPRATSNVRTRDCVCECARVCICVENEPAQPGGGRSRQLPARSSRTRIAATGGSNGAAKHEGVLVHMVYRETPVGCLAARIRDRHYAGLIG